MSGQPFIFPPPPPAPPPQTLIHQNTQQFTNRNGANWQNQSRGAQGGRGRGRGSNRGYGGGQRGHGHGNYTHGQSAGSPGYGNAYSGSPNYGGANLSSNFQPAKQQPYGLNGYGNYGPSASAPFQATPFANQQQRSYLPSPNPGQYGFGSQGGAFGQQQPSNRSEGGSYGLENITGHASFPAEPSCHQGQFPFASHPHPPSSSEPTIQQSFATPAQDHSLWTHAHANGSQGNVPPKSRQASSHSPFRGRGNRSISSRGHGEKRKHAREGDESSKAKSGGSQVAPAVPDFNFKLPIKPSVPEEHTKPAKKKKRRRNNQLGLTPGNQEQDTSDEGDDADEEVKLAAAVGVPSPGRQLLQFEYGGKTSVLQSSADIASWIAERKKRFPSRVRAAEVAENQRKADEARKADKQAQREQREKQWADSQERKKTQAKERKTGKAISTDSTGKAKTKLEKLRRALEKEEKRLAKAESKSSGAKPTEGTGVEKMEASQAATEQQTDLVDHQAKSATKSTVTTQCGAVPTTTEATLEPLTPVSQLSGDGPDGSWHPSKLAIGASSISIGLDPLLEDKAIALEDEDGPNTVSSELSSSSEEPSLVDSEESTSSSGSSDSDSSPEAEPSRRDGPVRVPPPKRAKPSTVCRAFVNSGRCRFGTNCRHRHELPARGAQSAKQKKLHLTERRTQKKTERKSLYQRLVEQELEQEKEKANREKRLDEQNIIRPNDSGDGQNPTKEAAA